MNAKIIEPNPEIGPSKRVGLSKRLVTIAQLME